MAPGTILGPSINRLLTDGNTLLCSQGFVLALFQSTTAYKITLQVTVNKLEVLSCF